MAFTNVWNDAVPADTQAASQGAADFRAFRVDVQQRMASISGLDSAKPAFGSDNTPANWNGILFFATDTGKIYQFNNPNWVDVTTDFQPFAPTLLYEDLTAPAIVTPGPINVVSIPVADLPVGAFVDILGVCGLVSAGTIIILEIQITVFTYGGVISGSNQIETFDGRFIVVSSGGTKYLNGFVRSMWGNNASTGYAYFNLPIPGSGNLTVSTYMSSSGAATGGGLSIRVTS